MIKGLTMEQFEKELRLNGGVKGRLMNRRDMQITEERTIREEEKDMFIEVCRYMNTLTKEEVYGNNAVEYVEAEVVGVVGQDFEFTDREDLVELPSWCTSSVSGIRYTETIESPYINKLY